MEIWKDIPDYEGRYQCSSLGRIKTLKRKRDGELKYTISEKILPQENNFGYLRISLSKNGAKKRYAVHRIVGLLFVPNDHRKPQINHKNGVKTDNSAENLEWCTGSENQKHAVKTGLKKMGVGEGHTHSKLTNEIVLLIREKHVPGKFGCRRIAKELGLSKANVQKIISRKTWNHI